MNKFLAVRFKYMETSIEIIRNKSELEGKAYIEIYPGRYKNTFWNEDSLYFNEESFGFIEKSIADNFNSMAL